MRTYAVRTLIYFAVYSHRNRLEHWNSGFKKKRDCTICVVKTKALISFAVTAKLICAFVLALAKIKFSYGAAHIQYNYMYFIPSLISFSPFFQYLQLWLLPCIRPTVSVAPVVRGTPTVQMPLLYLPHCVAVQV